MNIFRVYSGGDGHSHVEAMKAGEHPAILEAIPAHEISFHEVPTDFYNGFHQESQRTIVMMIDGQFEFGFKDGTSHKMNPGDVTLFEDFTGSGHDFKVSSNTPAVSAVIHVD